MLLLVVALWPASWPSLAHGDEVSFRRDLAPVLARKCETCHGAEKQKGGYRVDTFEALLLPGDSGELPLVKGNPDASLLLQLLEAADEDDRMPQQDDPLEPAVIDRFRRWIAAGCAFDGDRPEQSLAGLVAAGTQHPLPPEFYPHPLPVLSMALVRDGKQVAIGGYHEVLVRELPGGGLVQRLTNLPERIHALVPAVGDRWFYAGGAPGRAGEAGVIVAGEPPRVLARANDTLLTVALSGDGGRVAVGGADKLIRVLEVATGREELRLAQHADWIMGLAWNPDGSRLVSASRDGTARVFDSATGEMLVAFREHDGPVFGAVFVGTGDTVASGGRDGRVRFWKAGDAKQVANLAGPPDEVLRVTALGEEVLALGSRGGVQRFDAGRKSINHRELSGRGGVSLATGGADDLWLVGDAAGRITFGRLSESEPLGTLSAWPVR